MRIRFSKMIIIICIMFKSSYSQENFASINSNFISHGKIEVKSFEEGAFGSICGNISNPSDLPEEGSLLIKSVDLAKVNYSIKYDPYKGTGLNRPDF
jgi:hypothetical protein